MPTTKPVGFVAIDERVIAHEAHRIGRRQIEQVGCIHIGMNLLRPGKGGLEQAAVAQARRAAVKRKHTVVQRERVAFLDPERLGHWASMRSVLR